jgi:hypothetical protein
MKKIIALAVVAVAAAGFLGFTPSGHRVLSTLRPRNGVHRGWLLSDHRRGQGFYPGAYY